MKCLLFPVSLLFGLAVGLKNILYASGFFSGVTFSIPVISVGNLSVGGAGKTPHAEYLVRLLRGHLHVAVMSRGFGRDTTGFLLVDARHQSADAGDESLIFARKYPDVSVVVSESRSAGIPMLLQHRPDSQLVILDDAYQHRSVTPHLNILLTEYSAPFYSDWLMPSGSLREWRSAYRRADIIVVTKCPPFVTHEQRSDVLKKLRPLSHQRVFFSTYRYHDPYSMFQPSTRISLDHRHAVLLVSGVAKPAYLEEYVQGLVSTFDAIRFPDHHAYSDEDITVIQSRFENLPGTEKFLVTTEKDAVRLEPHARRLFDAKIPVFLVPVEVVFLFDEGLRFDDYVRQFLLDFKV